MKRCIICCHPHSDTASKCVRCGCKTLQYEPSQKEIQAACEKIQRTWTPRQRRSRVAADVPDVEIHETTSTARRWLSGRVVRK